MHVRQHIVLDAADLKRLTTGKPLTLTLDGTLIDLSLGGDADTRPLAGGNHRVGAKPGASRLTGMRGDCPHCGMKDVLLTPHFRHAHPEKPLPSYTGPGAVACTACKRTFPSNQSLAIHRIAHGQTKAERVRSNAKRVATMKAAKKAAGGPA